MKTVIGIRCAEIGEAEQQLYLRLLSFFYPEDVYFVVDGRKYTGVTNTSDKMIFVRPEEMDMPVPPDWGWRCGDIFYYALARRAQSDFYILVESDVWMTEFTCHKLFAALAQSTADYIAHDIRHASPDWIWHSTIQPFTDQVWSGNFALSRLSARAVASLYTERQAVNQHCLSLSQHVPNDESFVASNIMNCAELTSTPLLSLVDLDMSRFSPIRQIPVEYCTQDNYLYHSALAMRAFCYKFVTRLIAERDPHVIPEYFEYAFGDHPDADTYFSILRQALPPAIIQQLNDWQQRKLQPA